MTLVAATSGTGRVAWRRYSMIFAPALLAAGLLITLAGQGALAASFAVSGTSFKLAAETVTASGFVSYGDVVTSTDGAHHPVTPAGFATADLTDLCQSVVTDSPFGKVTMRLEAGKDEGNPVHAKNLVADFDQLRGNVVFTDYANGVDAAELSGGPSKGKAGGWGQQAKAITISGLQQRTWSTTAGTFDLKGLTIDVSLGAHECF